jgi:hypothetical protein
VTSIGRKRVRKEPSVERLKELLSYNPLTGELRWRIDRGGCKAAKAGDVAGTIRPDGYLIISIDGSPCLGHRIVWAIVTGKWPTRIVDHEDTNPSNNKWGNLRIATGSQSAANKNRPTNNSSGKKGVRRRKDRYLAQITVNQKHIFLGSFATENEAVAAYDAAALKHFGSFARASS